MNHILFVDGFNERYAPAYPLREFSTPTGSAPAITWAVNTSNGALTDFCIRLNNTAPGVYWRLPVSSTYTDTPLIGLAYKIQAHREGLIVAFGRDGQPQLELWSTSTGKLEVRRGEHRIARSLLGMTPNTWHYLEFGALLHPTKGSLFVFIDNMAAIVEYDWPTQGASGAGANHYGLGVGAFTSWVDDLYMASAPERLGKAVITTRPASDWVSPTYPAHEWTPSYPASTGAGYGTAGLLVPGEGRWFYTGRTDAELWALPAAARLLAPEGDVAAVQLNTIASRASDDTAPHRLQTGIRIGGQAASAVYDVARMVNTSDRNWTRYSSILPQNPITALPWTRADVSNIEMGLKAVR